MDFLFAAWWLVGTGLCDWVEGCVALGTGGGGFACCAGPLAGLRPGEGSEGRGFGPARRFGLTLPDALESPDSFLPALGRTHPSSVAGPSGVLPSCGALFDLACP